MNAATATVARYSLKLERSEVAECESRGSLTRPAEVAQFLWERIYSGIDREAFCVLYLNIRSEVTGWTVAYVGTIDHAPIEARGIFVPALLANAAAIILAHNHPSGNVDPSPEDLAMTGNMVAAGKLLGIAVYDHVIIGEPQGTGTAPRWASLKTRGCM